MSDGDLVRTNQLCTMSEYSSCSDIVRYIFSTIGNKPLSDSNK